MWMSGVGTLCAYAHYQVSLFELLVFEVCGAMLLESVQLAQFSLGPSKNIQIFEILALYVKDITFQLIWAIWRNIITSAELNKTDYSEIFLQKISCTSISYKILALFSAFFCKDFELSKRYIPEQFWRNYRWYIRLFPKLFLDTMSIFVSKKAYAVRQLHWSLVRKSGIASQNSYNYFSIGYLKKTVLTEASQKQC